jgi:hypothetical protein
MVQNESTRTTEEEKVTTRTEKNEGEITMTDLQVQQRDDTNVASPSPVTELIKDDNAITDITTSSPEMIPLTENKSDMGTCDDLVEEIQQHDIEVETPTVSQLARTPSVEVNEEYQDSALASYPENSNNPCELASNLNQANETPSSIPLNTTENLEDACKQIEEGKDNISISDSSQETSDDGEEGLNFLTHSTWKSETVPQDQLMFLMSLVSSVAKEEFYYCLKGFKTGQAGVIKMLVTLLINCYIHFCSLF